MSTPLLEFVDVTLAFGGVTALRDVNFTVEPGELFAVIGPNGAGKTSTFNCINGVYRPRQGSIRFRARTSSVESHRRSRASGSRGRSRTSGSS